MITPKYIAAGFMHDADKFFKDFLKCETNDFKTFCEVWKKHNFACIFMGRPDEKELREFINEIYQLTLNYMMSSGIESQIGAVYLLYALYRNQTVIAPVKIRINQSQFQVFQLVYVYAEQKNILSLHYVMDFLCDNCFDLVCGSTLYGPCCSKNRGDYMRPKLSEFGILSDLKQDMTAFQESNILQNLKCLHNQYLMQKVTIESRKNKIPDVSKEYDKYEESLNTLLHGNRRIVSKNAINAESIGSRRLQIKSRQFQRKAMFRYLNPDEGTIEDRSFNSIPIKRKRHYKKRLPVQQRRVGRPRKYFPNQTSSEESDSEESMPPPSPPKIKKTAHEHAKRRGPIGRKKVSYLKDYEGSVLLNASKSESAPVNDNSNDSSGESSGGLRF